MDPVDVTTTDRWAVPLLSLLGGLGLAGWSIYWDYRRRLPGAPVEPSSSASLASGGATSGGRFLEAALALMACAWLARHAADRYGAWLALIGYGSFVVGVALLAVHVGRRLASAPGGSKER